MSFLLYRIDEASHRYCGKEELVGAFSLWGKNGSVARCVGSQSVKTGGWCVTAKNLLADLVPRKAGENANPEHFVILDDLVPKGPERIVGRIDQINGYLDNDFNPMIITMTEVIYWQPPDRDARGASERPSLESPDVPGGNARIIKTINYLWNKWQPPGSFRGPILFRKHWEYLKQF